MSQPYAVTNAAKASESAVASDALAPLFILGAPRSGTSLLYKVLCLHRDTAYISNWVRRVPHLSAFGLLNRIASRFPDTRRNVWFGADLANAYVYERRRPLRARLFPMPVEGEPVYRRCGIGQESTPDKPYAVQADRLRHAFDTLRRYAGGRLVVSKRIANNQRIPLLREAFPDARFVHLIRDGRAVAYSLSRVEWWEDTTVWWYGDTPRSWRERGGDPWELCASHWVRELASIEDGLRTVGRSQQLQIRYEELIERPIPTLKLVAAFAGLVDDRRWARETTRLRYPNRNEAWRDQLPPDVRERVRTVQYDYLRRLGYVV